jgi:hypothetical protein
MVCLAQALGSLAGVGADDLARGATVPVAPRRHSGESRNPVRHSCEARSIDFECFARISHWIPAFAGMTALQSPG